MTDHTVEIVVPEDCDVPQAGETVTVEVAETEPILTAARRGGPWLPADCQQGWCTTCAAELLEGEADQTHAKRYYDVDAEVGLIPTCVARPRTDLRIRACQEEAMLEHRAANGLPPGRSRR